MIWKPNVTVAAVVERDGLFGAAFRACLALCHQNDTTPVMTESEVAAHPYTPPTPILSAGAIGRSYP